MQYYLARYIFEDFLHLNLTNFIAVLVEQPQIRGLFWSDANLLCLT